MSMIVILLSLAIVLPFNSAVNGQKRSREETLKEAGRIVTEAERRVGDAHKKVKEGGDRKLLAEAERGMIESFVKAIELWREAGHDQRLIAGVEELTRLYSVHGDYQTVFDRLTSEAEYWLARGDTTKYINTLSLLGTRQWQMRRDAASIETFERVIGMSRAVGLDRLELRALEQVADLYDRSGRAKDAEAARAKSRELRIIKELPMSVAPTPVQASKIPAQWMDLPHAPLAAEYRIVDGVNQAVLVNRSAKGIEMVMFGCVMLEESKTRVLHGLGGVGQNHGGVRPGFHYQPFGMLNGPLNRWTDEQMSCEGAAKMAVIEAHFDDNTSWKAEGTEPVIR
ncbi:MAG TPA: hypothetical protein VJT15_20850 [Pyrinomonadaceae bacterium]|nr:hypothetical protein [Pyrinomonadaceae bacterium]